MRRSVLFDPFNSVVVLWAIDVIAVLTWAFECDSPPTYQLAPARLGFGCYEHDRI